MRTLGVTLGAAALLVVVSGSNAAAQLAAAKDGPIVYGHHHLNTTNIAARSNPSWPNANMMVRAGVNCVCAWSSAQTTR